MDLTSRLFDAVQENSQSDILDHRQSDVPAEDDWIKASRESDWAAAQNASFESPTPVSQDSRLMRDLQQMLTEWQGLRDRGGIEFVETRLDAIENFLSELSQSNGTGGTVVSHSPDFHASSTPSSVRSTLLEEVSPIERQKPPIPERTLQLTTEEEVRQQLSSEQPAPAVILPDPPQAIDIDYATREELAIAVQERDSYIENLMLNLQALEQIAFTRVDLPELENLTEIQRGTIEIWVDGIRNELRQTQVQLSVERAHLSRDRMKLEHERQLMETESKRRNIVQARGMECTMETLAEDPKSKSWLNLFGSK